MSNDKTGDNATTGADVSHPDVLTVAEAAQLLGISPRSVQRRCREGKFSARRVESEFGEQWEIDRAAVEKAATDRATSARQEQRQASDAPTTEGTTEPRHVAPDAKSGNVASDFARYIAQRDDDLSAALLAEKDGRIADLQKQLEAANNALEREQAAHSETRRVLAFNMSTPSLTPPEPQNPPETPANRPRPPVRKARLRPVWKKLLGIR